MATSEELSMHCSFLVWKVCQICILDCFCSYHSMNTLQPHVSFMQVNSRVVQVIGWITSCESQIYCSKHTVFPPNSDLYCLFIYFTCFFFMLVWVKWVHINIAYFLYNLIHHLSLTLTFFSSKEIFVLPQKHIVTWQFIDQEMSINNTSHWVCMEVRM